MVLELENNYSAEVQACYCMPWSWSLDPSGEEPQKTSGASVDQQSLM